MSKKRKAGHSAAMLDLWRPPHGAGEPVGCLATTYTFHPGLFDEQCLARFLDIESEPNREDLAFLLERETRLGGVYAGVLVDHSQAGVEHSLRWDVLPVRIPAAKQHGKLSLLVWGRHVRIIVASANLTEPGYRNNYEVAGAVDLTPDRCDAEVAGQAIEFLRSLLRLVSGGGDKSPVVPRAEDFLQRVEQRIKGWVEPPRRETTRQRLVATLPAIGVQAERSSLDEAVQEFRRRGAGSPEEVWSASPFFDVEGERSHVAATVCKAMARGAKRRIRLCVPAVREGEGVPRLAAPIGLLKTPPRYDAAVSVEMLPELDRDKNRRPWHAKLLAFRTDAHSALMIGSSNFTTGGLGLGSSPNAEVNLLTVIERVEYGRDAGQLEAVWPDTEPVADPNAVEWIGAKPEEDEEEQASLVPAPAGFLSATYRAGDVRVIVLRVDAKQLPADWQVHADAHADSRVLVTAATWRDAGSAATLECPWSAVHPPEKLRVTWDGHEAFLPLNVEDGAQLPPPAALENMSADEMLEILAATDPSAAFRAWAAQKGSGAGEDDGLDSATPIDLDPLRRYDLHATFLHRVRRRARVLAQLRANVQRPVWGRQSLEWRLRGLVGVDALGVRLAHECTMANGATNEALLTLADFLIVLREVDYQATEGALGKKEFDGVFRPFLRELAEKLERQVAPQRDHMSEEMHEFWSRVVKRCAE